ncbi:MAG: hypothetical protein AVDCRST_MAG08-433, partial [uncultured Acetobacteraceae bacterium]
EARRAPALHQHRRATRVRRRAARGLWLGEPVVAL